MTPAMTAKPMTIGPSEPPSTPVALAWTVAPNRLYSATFHVPTAPTLSGVGEARSLLPHRHEGAHCDTRGEEQADVAPEFHGNEVVGTRLVDDNAVQHDEGHDRAVPGDDDVGADRQRGRPLRGAQQHHPERQ